MSNRNLFAYPQVGRRPSTALNSTQSLINVLSNIGGIPALGLYVAGQGMFQDAVASVPAVAENDPIGCWKDLSGNGRNGVQLTGANRPVLNRSVLNGRPGVKFNGTLQELAISPGYPDFGAGAHAYVVAGYTTNPTAGGGGQVIANFGVGGANTLPLEGNLPVADKWGTFLNAGTVEAPGQARLNAFQHYLLGASFNAGAVRLYRNATTTEGVFGGSTPGFTWSGNSIGSGGGGGYTPCWVELMVVYPQILVGANLTTVVTSIANYYGISLGAQAVINQVRGFNPDVFLMADVGLLQTPGGVQAYQDGDPVGQWIDQSANARHALQATAGKRPTLRLNVTNGKPSVRFDAANAQIMEGPYPFSGINTGTILVVFRESLGTQPEVRSSSGAAVSGGTDHNCLSVTLIANTRQIQALSAFNGGISSSNVYPPNTFNIAYARLDGVNVTAFLNGVQTLQAYAPNTLPTVYTIGGDAASTPAYLLTGDICCLIRWSGAVSDANLTTIYNTLRTHYGTT